jgi:hypothetical protein
MIDIEKLEQAFQQATERAIKIHDALDIPYVTANNNQVVEMLHGEVIRVIEPTHNIARRLS